MSVNFAPDITAPLASFTDPAMLPVGEADTVGAIINKIAETNDHIIEDTLGRFIPASVEIFRMRLCLSNPGYSETFKTSKAR